MGLGACAANGHATAAPPRRVMNSRLRMSSMKWLPPAGHRTAACNSPAFDGTGMD